MSYLPGHIANTPVYAALYAILYVPRFHERVRFGGPLTWSIAVTVIILSACNGRDYYWSRWMLALPDRWVVPLRLRRWQTREMRVALSASPSRQLAKREREHPARR